MKARNSCERKCNLLYAFLLILWMATGSVYAETPDAPVNSTAGNSIPLTFKMTIIQPTCDMTLLTSNGLTFSAVNARDFTRGKGAVQRLGEQTITLGLVNCASSAIPGSTPAIQVLGDNPFSEEPTIFSNDNSTASGLIGFGLRHQSRAGVVSDYLKSGDNVDLASTGGAVSDGQENFLVNVLYGGGEVGNGFLLTNFTFRFLYH